jgi:glycosyltransferase involved in cell wall biosynthesis
MSSSRPRDQRSDVGVQRRAFLGRGLVSIRRQSYRDFEFIIIDDGSTDGTPEILSRHAADDSRLRVVRQRIVD